ncbi:nucleotide exchange factor GrpE [Candidatus Bathyarchaeota archaeon]|nr:nucleotide exchange factor GrpE [Candidatus Bathyarchaeota archaeon]
MQAKIYKDFLPFFDAFYKAIENNTALLEKYGDLPQEVQKYLKGIQGLYKNMNGILESKDLARMNVVGKPFDYNYHDVIMKIEDADVEEDTVVREVQKGWLLDGKVLRPAGVAVAKNPPKKEEASKDGEGNDGKESQEDTSGNSDAGGEQEEKQ